MVDTFTNNFDFTVLTVGGDSGTWGGIVNNTITSPLDLILGGTQAITLSSTNVTLTTTQWQNKAFKLTGTLLANVSLILPLSVNASGGTPGVGGEFVVWNNCSGNFSVTVLTAATGSIGVTVPQGARATLYSDTVNVWYANDAFSIPAGTVADFAGATAPPGWLLCFGQSVLRAQYPALFNVISTTYGSADGSHFNIPDYRGRVLAGVDNMGGSAANRLTSGGSGINGVSLGASGGNELLQSHTHANTLTDPGHLHSIQTFGIGNTNASNIVGQNFTPSGSQNTSINTTGITINNASVGGGGSQNAQPTIMTNKMIFAGA